MSETAPLPSPDQQQGPDQQAQEEQRMSRVAQLQHNMAIRYQEGRMNRAANVMERMDHKDALYTDLARMAIVGAGQRVSDNTIEARMQQFRDGGDGLSGVMINQIHDGEAPLAEGEFLASPTARGEAALPRTRAERHMDKKIDKRGVNVTLQSIETRQNTKIYGEKPPKQDLHLRERAAKGILGNRPEGAMSAVIGTEGNGTDVVIPQADARGRLKEVGYDAVLLGGTGHGKPSKLAGKVARSYRHRGRNRTTTARERRLSDAQERLDTKLDLGKQTQHVEGKKQRRVEKKLRQASNQEFLSRWRNMRRNRAIGRIQKAHKSIESHLEALDYDTTPIASTAPNPRLDMRNAPGRVAERDIMTPEQEREDAAMTAMAARYGIEAVQPGDKLFMNVPDPNKVNYRRPGRSGGERDSDDRPKRGEDPAVMQRRVNLLTSLSDQDKDTLLRVDAEVERRIAQDRQDNPDSWEVPNANRLSAEDLQAAERKLLGRKNAIFRGQAYAEYLHKTDRDEVADIFWVITQLKRRRS